MTTQSLRLPDGLQPFAIRRGGIVFFNARSALDLLNWLGAVRVKVLRVDGFFLSSQSTMPSMEHSIDLSEVPDSLAEAKRHIEKLSDQPMFFEVVADADIELELS